MRAAVRLLLAATTAAAASAAVRALPTSSVVSVALGARRPLGPLPRALRGGASMAAAAADTVAERTVPTSPIEGQKPGTSGVRKRTSVFMQPHYVANLVQSFFDVLPADELRGSTIVVGGDGRYYGPEAAQAIMRLAAANGVARVWVGVNGLIATPAVSALLREREGGCAYCGIVLTASHNPGGPDNDFGIKFNMASGGPATEAVTDEVYARTKTIDAYREADLPPIDLSAPGVHRFALQSGGAFEVEVVDSAETYVEVLRKCFDFDALRKLLARSDFDLRIDAMHGAAGPYMKRVLGELLGVPDECLLRCDPRPDFGGAHPDPNLTYAAALVKLLGLSTTGAPLPGLDGLRTPDFGAATDGDGDRNMILGRGTFVTPSDSIAIVAAHAHVLPQFASAGGLRAVARSMPTGGAVDRVAAQLGIPCFETPSGWKFFGNLMDSRELGGTAYDPLICGEESFGLGSSHVREKDGVWAVLCWLSILAHHNGATPEGQLVGVGDVLRAHWATYGRNYYSRHDYEEVDADAAKRMMARLGAMAAGDEQPPASLAGGRVALSAVESFAYTDPVDGTTSANQGLVCKFEGGARAVFRLSGTGSVGATVRLYAERYEHAEAGPDALHRDAQDALADVLAAAAELAQIEHFTGRDRPTVIT